MSDKERYEEQGRMLERRTQLIAEIKTLTFKAERIADAYSKFALESKKRVQLWRKEEPNAPIPPIEPPQDLRETVEEFYSKQVELNRILELLGLVNDDFD